MKVKIINESISDVLKPKSQDEIDSFLEKIPINDKIEEVKDFFLYNVFELMHEFVECGADEEILTNLFLNIATTDELKEMVDNLIFDNADPLWTVIESFNEPEQAIVKVFHLYTNKKDADLDSVLNTMIKKHTGILKDYSQDDEYDDEY